MINIHKKSFLLRVLPLLTLLFLTCSGTKIAKLKDTIDRYNRAYKWGGSSATASLLEENARPEIMKKKLKQMNGKSIAEYSLADIALAKDKKTATAVVQYSFIDQHTQSLHAFAEIQTWKLKKGKWELTRIEDSKQKVSKTFE